MMPSKIDSQGEQMKDYIFGIRKLEISIHLLGRSSYLTGECLSTYKAVITVIAAIEKMRWIEFNVKSIKVTVANSTHLDCETHSGIAEKVNIKYNYNSLSSPPLK